MSTLRNGAFQSKPLPNIVEIDDPLDDKGIGRFVVCSLIVAACLIVLSALIYAKTTNSHRTTFNLVNDAFELREVLHRIDRQIEYYFTRAKDSGSNNGMLYSFSERLLVELETASELHANIDRFAQLKNGEDYSPVGKTIKQYISNGNIDKAFWEFHSNVKDFAEGRELVGGIDTWRHNVSLNSLRIYTLQDRLINKLKDSAAQELQLYTNIQVALLLFVTLVLVFLWLRVYRPLLSSLRQQHLVALQNFIKFHHIARHDDLTEIANRFEFNQRLEQLIISDQYAPFALILFDIDRFKKINDLHGHHVGDNALIHFTTQLKLVFEDAICIARLGGDEFAVLIDYTSTPEIDQLIEAAVKEITFLLDSGATCRVNVTAGYALHISPKFDAQTLIKLADRALFLNKDSNRIPHSSLEHPRLPLNINHNINQAIENDEFYTLFQPIFNHQNRPIAVESLVRWDHPEFENIPITDWFSVAESSDAAIKITRKILDDSLQFHLRLISMGIDTITHNVNVSGPRPIVEQCLDEFAAVIDTHPSFGDHLSIELTENVIFKPGDLSIMERLNRLARRGVRTTFDDFGTGYATLSHLLDIPIDQIKIDQRFIKSIDSPINRSVVMCIVRLAQQLGAEIVAEGIENLDQLKETRKIGCTHFQGNYLQKPRDARTIAASIERALRGQPSSKIHTLEQPIFSPNSKSKL